MNLRFAGAAMRVGVGQVGIWGRGVWDDGSRVSGEMGVELVGRWE